MSNKMLIDASHPEETRVAVVRGNRIEEYDFESQEKRQLKGNIYLAKVTRVEPSLQAAFVDYGGNRHGFLAFSEIHPDYYQIPVADRQALLEAEAAEARAAQEADNEDQGEADDSEEANVEAEAPRKKSRRRRGKKKNAEASASDVEADESAETSEETAQEAEAASNETSETEAVEEQATAVEASESDSSETAESEETKAAEAKPKRRRTTRRKPKKEAAVESSDDTNEGQVSSDDDNEDGGDDGTTVMSAIVETDSISEPLPEDSDEDEVANDDDSGDEPVAEEKPKRRRTSRPRKTKEAIADDASDSPESTEEAPSIEVAASAVDGDASVIAAEQSDATAEKPDEETSDSEEEQAKPKRRTKRRTGRKKKVAEEAVDEDETAKADDDNRDDQSADDADDDVESVGQEDELEEIASPRRQRKHYKIQEVIKRRQVLLVQVVKEERGNKGAALTTYLSLAGRYSVLMPNTAKGGGISRKITNSADRKRLKSLAEELDVPTGMGVILRTSCASRTDAEIRRDFEYLMRLWEQVRTLTLSSTAPCLVYEEGSLIKRSIRDLYDKDTAEVVVSGEAGFEEAKEFMGMLMPSHTRKVKRYKGGQALFTKHGVESQLDKMLMPQVTLKSGGYLVINQTEALVAVDVNSGRATREHSVENTALQTNLEAAEEVARQLRLRDLAGLIVIDFIDMEERRNNRAVEKKLKDCLKNDRARIQVGRISHFGLMEMSRQRMRASVLESTMDVCQHCAGTGYVRSDSAIALHVYRAIEEHVSRHNRYDCIVKTTTGTALHVLNHKRSSLTELEERFGLKILIEASETAKGQEFSLHKGEIAQGTGEQAAIGMQNGIVADDAGSESDEENPDGNSSRRGRGRGRGRKNRNEENSETDPSEETAVETNNDDETNDEDLGGRRKRRRGKRGGRKNREVETEASESGASESVEAVSETSTDDGDAQAKALSDEATSDATAIATEEAEKPKRRSTRRKKAPVAEPSDTDANTNNSATSPQEASAEPEASEDAPEAPKPKRRRVSRPGKVAAEENASNAENSVTEPSVTDGNNDNSDNPSEEGSKGSDKKPWWSGGGFF